MASGPRRRYNPGSLSIVNRLAQLNVALAVSVAGMIRLSMSFSDTQSDRPDPLAVLGFFLAITIAGVLVFFIRKQIHLLKRKWHRIAAALITFGVQLALLEILILVVAE